MRIRALRAVVLVLVWMTAAPAASLAGPPPPAPATLLWYSHPAEKWENALPVGNGRLGAMVFGRADEEIIQLNEDTYWSGGPYSTTVAGGTRLFRRSAVSSSTGSSFKHTGCSAATSWGTRSNSRSINRWATSS